MNKRELLRSALAVAGTCVIAPGAMAAETINLTVAAAHPATTPWVRLMAEQFVPEVRERVAALGPGWSTQISEFYGGQLYKMNASLTSVSDGIADIGWVLAPAEPARLPLSQFSAAMPFASADLRAVLAVVNEMNDSVPELAEEWDRNGLVFLGAVVSDPYHLFTRTPLQGFAQLQGLRISVPGALGQWLKGSGAVAVDGALTSYYTDIQTGVSDGTISVTSGVVPLRIHEVAPHVSLVDVGCMYAGGLVMNKGRFQSMPAQVQGILREAGRHYSASTGEAMSRAYDGGLKALEAMTTRQPNPVTLNRWPQAQRLAWARSLPNLAGDWVSHQRSPEAARRIVHAYLEGLRRRGAQPLRDWALSL
ncbi:MAG: C4-dicarboxylate TRAP transporter substrate-binding protein [Hydrogenophaga sp.]|uniref:C4-dicarboxylate TRAP transporter substrate-binding protein n=1 Tax=Hydrogenophaga sp. TaxID=1904254 RepID=UPI001D215824|nr:C4-dicarboxylate TRAP transporter substrate-binding protein [Hydrogenophaga sp.]MBX3611803.1 C4-dicarboxylate TRAP transporter substrate-binding protein [Hydrogenophaga sp.]